MVLKHCLGVQPRKFPIQPGMVAAQNKLKAAHLRTDSVMIRMQAVTGWVCVRFKPAPSGNSYQALQRVWPTGSSDLMRVIIWMRYGKRRQRDGKRSQSKPRSGVQPCCLELEVKPRLCLRKLISGFSLDYSRR